MCHFITATLPQNVEQDAVAGIFKSYNLAFNLISNPHVLSQLNPKDIYILTTTGHCDCGTVLGMLNRSEDSKAVSYERELEKHRKQGWSEAKIQRWLAEKEQVKEKTEREDEAQAEIASAEATRWTRFISDLLQLGHIPRIGLLLHLYGGGIESERIRNLKKEEIKLADLTPRFIMAMEEDVLYEFLA
jgi:hypothetical protein